MNTVNSVALGRKVSQVRKNRYLAISCSFSAKPSAFNFVSQRAMAHVRVVTVAAQAQSFCTPAANRGLTSIVEEDQSAVLVEVVRQGDFGGWVESQPEATATWAAATNFKGKDGEVLLVPAKNGGLERVVLGAEDPSDLWMYAGLYSKLPPGVYRLVPAGNADVVALGWMLGSYTFDRYKSTRKEGIDSVQKAQLVWPEGCDRVAVTAIAEGTFLARDMITTPAEDLAPQHIVAEALALGDLHSVHSTSVISGDDLLSQGYPAVHTVGRASSNPPQLVDFRWSPPGHDAALLPQVTLVGKGVCFDTGGLDLKPPAGMKLMKKDMGGAALVLGLAHAVMKAQISIRLRVLIPTVENSVSGNSFRPLDVLQTRAGITVENGNTDAEGRLILCDALAEAAAEKPDIIIDAATLTGAARVALGTELPALFCNNEALAVEMLAAGEESRDSLWRLPLHKPYRKLLDSKVADIYSCSEGGYAGAITAALFLQEFVGDCQWAHLDTMAYNLSSKPGRPEGGEAFALRALFHFLRKRYGALA